MFIKRKEYEELKETKLKCSEAEYKITELKIRLEQYESNLHQCDDLCEGCQHLIKGSELYYTSYSTGCREMTTRKCALDRTCKDYKKKEDE